jgi:undecaprenyl-diphosphatase
MNLLEVLLLGIIQGLTEFLPISSSGHLVIFQNLFGLKEPDLFLDVSLHCGTLCSILIVFRKEVFALMRGVVLFSFYRIKGARFKIDEECRAMAWLSGLIVVGLIPTALLGFFFRDLFTLLFSSLTAVGSLLVVTGTLLWFTRTTTRGTKKTDSISLTDALIIGLVQGFAIAPGISRSGATIAFGLFRNLREDAAVHFSFLLSIPAILGALFMEWENPFLYKGVLLQVLSGTIMAALVGYICLRILIGMVKKGQLYFFSPYCWTAGCITIVLSFLVN